MITQPTSQYGLIWAQIKTDVNSFSFRTPASPVLYYTEVLVAK